MGTVRVYANVPGAEFRIGNHGTATNDRPALVPAAVAQELKSDLTLRIAPDEPALAAAAAPKKLSASALKDAQKGKDTES